MEQDRKVSFVIPVYKTEKFVKKSVESLLNNDYKNIELVCVLDGHNKEAESILKRLQKKDHRIIKVLEIPHGGACRARNEGFKPTTGDYVSFWDSDCYAETGMIRMWVQTFKDNPDATFVYSGYAYVKNNDSYFASEPFNEYQLTCENYVSMMFPFKREAYVPLDETVKSLQDWDFWLRIVKNGGKGVWIEGIGFTTEPSVEGNISYDGTRRETWLDRYNTVRAKNGITGRKLCFCSPVHRFRGMQLAKLYGQDYLDNPSYHPTDYKAIYCIGFYPQTALKSARAFKDAPDGCRKILHFTGIDAELVQLQAWKQVQTLIKVINDGKYEVVAECEQTAKFLDELGVKTMTIMPLPMQYIDTPMPKDKFRVFVESDRGTAQAIAQIVEACPDIEFTENEGVELKDITAYLGYTASVFPSENLKRFGAAGRYLVTNYKRPYGGFTEPEIEGVIRQLRKYKADWRAGIAADAEQVNYWRGVIDTKQLGDFIEKI